MSCCGQKRTEWMATENPAQSRLQPAELLQYLEHSPIVVHGPVSGRAYAFSGESAIQSVASVDAERLVQTRFFRRVG